MKAKYNEKSQTFSLTGLSNVEYSTLCRILNTANERCFEIRENDGMWYSNDDFVCALDDDREALRSLCKEI
jgi:hypothetical protein